MLDELRLRRHRPALATGVELVDDRLRGPAARIAASFRKPSSCSYRWERSAEVVTLPIIEHATAISTTEATTSRVRGVGGCGRLLPRLSAPAHDAAGLIR